MVASQEAPSHAPREPPPRWGAIRVAGVVLTAAAGIPWALTLLAVLRSHLGPPVVDPHGYVLLFGTVLALPLGAAVSLGVALSVPAAARLPAYLVSLAVVLGVWVLLVAMSVLT